MEKLWCEPLKIKTTPMACKLRRKNLKINECDGCLGPKELTAEDAEDRREEIIMEVKKDIPAASSEDLRCKAEGCDNPITKISKSGLCRPCSTRVIGSKYRQKAAETRKRHARERKEREKSQQSAVGGRQSEEKENSLQDAGFMYGKQPSPSPQPARQAPVSSPRGEGAPNITFSFNTPIPENSLIINFSEYPKLLDALRVAAKAEFRNQEQQVLFILNDKLETGRATA